MRMILVKLKFYLTEKCQKRKKTLFHILAKPRQRNKYRKENQTISIPYLLQAQPALSYNYWLALCGSTTMCIRNGNCVDPNHTDS